MADKALLVADVAGLSHYHVGDEAILTSRVAWVRRALPGVIPVAVSADPQFTSVRHTVRALEEPSWPAWLNQPWVFRWSRSPGAARLFVILCRGCAPGLWSVLREVRQSKALLICGGGSLTSTYGSLLRFRSLLAGYALASGVPVSVSGQQIGPSLTHADAGILKRWLPRALQVGVRDAASFALAREIGVSVGRLVVTGDDALDLDTVVPGQDVFPCMPTKPMIGLSLHLRGGCHERHNLLARLVSVIGPWLRCVDASLLWLPHLRSDVLHRCDVKLAHDFARESGLGERVIVADRRDLLDVHIKYLTGCCDFVVSTRYHGAVFALSSGVPVMALSQDAYTEAKLQGLFGYCGLDWPVIGLDNPELPLALRVAWERRHALAGQIRTLWPSVFTRYREKWDDRSQWLKAIIDGAPERGMA